MSILKNVAAYQLIRLLSKPFTKWDAYEKGLIDKDGDTLRKPKNDSEKKAFGMFQRLIRRIKQIISKAPFGAFKIASLAVALKLLKEETGHDLTSELEQFGVNNSLFESVDQQNGVISKGKYMDSDSNMFIIKEDLLPIDNIISVNIYEVNEIMSNKPLIITEFTIKKL